MNRNFSIALLVFGLIVLMLGYRSANSTASIISHIFTGRPTRETTWMFATGAIAAIAGLAGLFRGEK